MSSEHTYQAELDGLRALAVIGVLLCHLEVAWLPGGFVGVDIFFVLSGFLITRLIATEINETGHFRFGNFYLRRIRRLYPALVTTIVVAWIASFFLLSPAQLENFALSAIAALFSFSNILFYSQANYFDALATTKPLLHTWSLSVEEQFYLLWPLTLLLASRLLGRRGMIVVLAVISIASLALAQYWLTANTTAAFYMLPARAIELGLGALVVFLPALRSRWLLNAATTAGIIAMLVPMALFTAATPFPGLSAMLPCLGAALFIAGARSDAAAPFRFGPVAWVGRISYSLYLVHWPLIVLWRAYFYRPIEGLDAVLLGALAVLAAWLQYTLIEQRFRRPVPGRNRRVIAAMAAIGISLSAVSVQAAMTNGWRWRIPQERLTQTANARDSEANCGHFNPDLDRKLVTCQNYRGMNKDLFVWGDSHAAHLAAGLAAAYPDRNIYIFYQTACPPQSGFGGYLREYSSASAAKRCARHNRKVFDYLMAGPTRDIVITSAKRETPKLVAKVTLPIIAALEEKGNKVAFLGDFIRPGVSLVDCVAAPAFVVSESWLRARCVGDPKVAAAELDYNKKLASRAPSFISPSHIQCPDGMCRFFDGARLLFRDDHHFNDLGSQLFMREMKPLLPF